MPIKEVGQGYLSESPCRRCEQNPSGLPHCWHDCLKLKAAQELSSGIEEGKEPVLENLLPREINGGFRSPEEEVAARSKAHEELEEEDAEGENEDEAREVDPEVEAFLVDVLRAAGE